MGVGELPPSIVGAAEITDQNREFVRRRLERHFRLKADDCIVLLQKTNEGVRIGPVELQQAMQRHEAAMGLGAMRVFLSHKGADKPSVREYDRTLRLLGFDTWLDEDAMTAGTHLERGISSGFRASCAAVFFVTSNYKDEGYLSTEVDYAIREKRAKGDKFQIITIALNGVDGRQIPELLRSYVWRSPKQDLEAVQEILKALPISIGTIYWR